MTADTIPETVTMDDNPDARQGRRVACLKRCYAERARQDAQHAVVRSEERPQARRTARELGAWEEVCRPCLPNAPRTYDDDGIIYEASLNLSVSLETDGQGVVTESQARLCP